MKKIISVLSAFVLIVSLCVMPSAATPRLLADDLGLLSESEATAVESMLEEVSDKINANIVVVTTSDLDGKSDMAYADDYFDYNGYGDDGVLFLVYSGESDIRLWISTKGSGIRAFTDYGIERALDRIIEEYYDNGWESAFLEFAEISDDYFAQAEAGSPFDIDDGFTFDINDSSDVLKIAGMSLLFGFIISLIVVSVMKGKLRSVRPQNSAGDYVRKDSMILTEKSDEFLYKSTTKTYSPQNNDSGGSSTHTSSSGSSHGGGGRSL